MLFEYLGLGPQLSCGLCKMAYCSFRDDLGGSSVNENTQTWGWVAWVPGGRTRMHLDLVFGNWLDKRGWHPPSSPWCSVSAVHKPEPSCWLWFRLLALDVDMAVETLMLQDNTIRTRVLSSFPPASSRIKQRLGWWGVLRLEVRNKIEIYLQLSLCLAWH